MQRIVWAGALALALPLVGIAQEADDAPPVKTLGVVSVTGPRPTSLPTQIPTTMESATREQIERSVNATDSEDALKYFPSLLVRKRYIGDYNHAILSSRASGTGNSARSAVYADGILLSNYLGNGVGGLSFPPRWGLVTPEEIERVDVMYGPFSAAYPGNSVGAVVDYVTRMPTRLEAHAAVGYVVQPFELYRTHETYRAWQASASLGAKAGDLVLVDERQPHRQRRPAADLRDPAGQHRHARNRGNAGQRRRARLQQRQPALVAAGRRHPVRHPPGSPQAEARLRPDADAAGELRLRPLAQRIRGRRQLLPARRQRHDRLQRPDQHRRPQLHADRR